MADNNFRSYRGRDAGAPARSQPDDPLAELARLIGQSDPAADHNRDPRSGRPLDQPAGDWADDRYADQNEPAGDDYAAPADERYAPAHQADQRYDAPAHQADQRYAPEQQPDLLPNFRPGPPSYDDAYKSPATPPYSLPARGINGAHNLALPEPPRFQDAPAPVQALGRQPPGFLSQSFDDRDYDDPDQQDAADQAYALEDYEEEEEVPARRRRSGLVVVTAVLGLAVLGTAGAFAYRAMFGSSMLPSLPPIIKADGGPNKIVPNKPKSNASDQASANDAASGEKLVSREEQPVDVPAPANSAPREVATVPIFPDPNSGQSGVPSSAQGAAAASVGAAFPPPPASSAQANVLPSSTGALDMAAGPEHGSRGWCGAGRRDVACAAKNPHRHHPNRPGGFGGRGRRSSACARVGTGTHGASPRCHAETVTCAAG